jgi:hypothetical protein
VASVNAVKDSNGDNRCGPVIGYLAKVVPNLHD